MNILVQTTPSDGHINPLFPLVNRLVEEGHQVVWYTGKVFQQKIETAGAIFKPIVRAVDHGGVPKAQAFPELEGLEGLNDFIGSWKAIFLDSVPLHLADLEDILEEFPADVLLSDETSFATGLLAEKTGLPRVVVSTSVYFYRSRDTAPLGMGMLPDASFVGRLRNRMVAWVADTFILRELRQYADKTRRSIGLNPLPGGVLQNVVPLPDLYLMSTIPEFEYPRSDLIPGTHFIGSLNLANKDDYTFPDWWDKLQDERPVVHITQGTVSNKDAHQLLIPAIQGLANEDVLVIATTGGERTSIRDLETLPENTILEPYVPHNHLLPHVDVMITNGGYGGVQTALQHGVPLVVAGATEEKPDVAARVEWSGTGINLRQSHPEPAAIARATIQVLNNAQYRECARTMMAKFAEYDAPALAVKHIEALVNQS